MQKRMNNISGEIISKKVVNKFAPTLSFSLSYPKAM